MSGWLWAVLVLGAYGFYRARWAEPGRWVVERHTVPLPSLPPSLDGLEIIHLTDLHLAGAMGDREHALIETLRNLPAPVVAFTGDYVHEDGALANLVPLLMEIGKDKQAFAVLGDGDYQVPGRARRLLPVLEGAGVVPLLNRAVTLSAGGGRLWLVGLDDPSGTGSQQGAAEAFREVATGEPVVALAHSPAMAQEALARGAHLVLTGHTLGSRRGPRGLVRQGPGWLYGNRGWGTPGSGLRLFNPPEIAVLRLVKAPEGAAG